MVNRRIQEFPCPLQKNILAIACCRSSHPAGSVRRDENGNLYKPDHIPASTRRQYIFLSSVLLACGAFGAWIDDIYIPGKSGPGVHFHGVPLWFLLGAMIAVAANMISVVADHYDKRNDEFNYRRFARITEILGWILFVVGFVVDFFVFKSSSIHSGS